MPLILYNTLTRQKEAFLPLDPHNVRLYLCGPTVYDFAHIGNARPTVIFDVLSRLLRSLYPKITFVRNITDIEDKIIKAAQDNKENIADLTQRTTRYFREDMNALGNRLPDIEPLATDHVSEMMT
jgi:cysteinyl-tRNA synthetase